MTAPIKGFDGGKKMAIEAAFCYMILAWDEEQVSRFISTEQELRESWVSRNLDRDAQNGYDSIMNELLLMAKSRAKHEVSEDDGPND